LHSISFQVHFALFLPGFYIVLGQLIRVAGYEQVPVRGDRQTLGFVRHFNELSHFTLVAVRLDLVDDFCAEIGHEEAVLLGALGEVVVDGRLVAGNRDAVLQLVLLRVVHVHLNTNGSRLSNTGGSKPKYLGILALLSLPLLPFPSYSLHFPSYYKSAPEIQLEALGAIT